MNHAKISTIARLGVAIRDSQSSIDSLDAKIKDAEKALAEANNKLEHLIYLRNKEGVELTKLVDAITKHFKEDER